MHEYFQGKFKGFGLFLKAELVITDLVFIFSLLACLCKLQEKSLTASFVTRIVSECKLVFTEKNMVRGSEHFFICTDWYFKY